MSFLTMTPMVEEEAFLTLTLKMKKKEIGSNFYMVCTVQYCQYRRSTKYFHYLTGVILASISGILFTANNFVINQSQVDVGDVVLVRTAVQMAVYVTILIAREESFLPSSTEQKMYTVLQGKVEE